MAFTKVAAVLLMVSVVAVQGQTYFNKPVSPEAAETLATANEILCTYLNVNCPDNGIGFSTPPAPPPPTSPPSPAPAPASGPTAVLDEKLQELEAITSAISSALPGRKMLKA